MTREEAEKYANNMTYRDAINNLMKARSIPYRKATFIKVNELLKALDQEPCEDVISRQAVLDITWEEPSYTDALNVLTEVRDKVKELPSVNPQEKTGHWEWVQYDYNPKIGNWHCTECRCVVVECVDKNEKGGIPLYKYCPQCGAKMIEPQESEEKG